MGEARRVLKADGRLVIVDVGYPGDGGWLGTHATRLWQLVGNIIRDLPALLWWSARSSPSSTTCVFFT